jgi:GntR family transcriptional repressor for pyruvate dehydrogenase complex
MGTETDGQHTASRSTELLATNIIRAPLYEQVAGNIQDWIISQTLRPGDQLPSERVLCERFGVSRTVVREATKALAERGLVSIQAGRGTFVSQLSVEDLAESMHRFLRFSDEAHEDLLDVRELMEVKIAELAAQRATPEDCRRLEAAVEAMEEAHDDPERYMAGDLAFHCALAEATHSAVFVVLVNSIVGFLHDIRRLGFRVNAPERGRIDHRRIYRAVRDHDCVEAQDAMRQHLCHVREDIERSKAFS